MTRELHDNTARAIGRDDCCSYCARLGMTDGVARLASGPLHFAHAGWAFVDIHDDSAPRPDDNCFLHYDHPNTFESEVLAAKERTSSVPACVFSAGYSAAASSTISSRGLNSSRHLKRQRSRGSACPSCCERATSAQRGRRRCRVILRRSAAPAPSRGTCASRRPRGRRRRRRRCRVRR